MAAAAAVALTALLSLPAAVDAMRGSEAVTASEFDGDVAYSFGAFAGADLTMQFTLTSPEPPLKPPAGVWMWALLANTPQLSELIPHSVRELCASDVAGMAPISAQLGWFNTTTISNTSWALTYTAPSADNYYIIWLNCAAQSMSFTYSYHFVNPGGQELSSGVVPLLTVTVVVAGTWGALMLLQLVGMAVVRALWKAPAVSMSLAAAPALNPIRTLHWSLLAPAALALVAAVVANTYYAAASHDGVFNVTPGNIAVIVHDLSEACLLGIILLLAKGWQVTRLAIEGGEVSEGRLQWWRRRQYDGIAGATACEGVRGLRSGVGGSCSLAKWSVCMRACVVVRGGAAIAGVYGAAVVLHECAT